MEAVAGGSLSTGLRNKDVGRYVHVHMYVIVLLTVVRRGSCDVMVET